MTDENTRGAEWARMTDTELVGHAAHAYPNVPLQAPVVEMQRRLIVAIRAFNEQSKQQTETLIRAIRDFDRKAGRQANVMIGLTVAIALLTVAIAVLTAILVQKG